MKAFVWMGLVVLGFTSLSQGADYVDLGNVKSFRCESESGRTVVNVNFFRGFYEITTIQDRTLMLHYRVRTRLRVQESFPATYVYAGRTTGNTYLVLGQSTRDMEFFSEVGGVIHYEKFNRLYKTPVTCDVF